MKIHKKLSVILLLAISVVIMSFKVDADKDKPAEKFKNLKVLSKNMSHDDLIAVMKNYCTALGVRCNHCHVKNGDKLDFVSDDNKEKGIARKMQKMANAINKKYFGGNTGTVGCMTCHNGKVNPADASAADSKKADTPK